MDLDYSRHYRKWHADTDQHFDDNATGATIDIVDDLPSDRSAAIFELGAGMCICLNGLRKLGYCNLTGIDSDRSQVEAARKRDLPVQLVTVAETLDWLRERRSRFDFAYAIDVLEHIPREALIPLARAIAGTLKPDARFVCRVPNSNSVVAMRQRYNDWTHEDCFSANSLDFVLYNAGFDVLDIRNARDLPSRRMLGHVRRLVRSGFRGVRRLQYLAENISGARTMPIGPNIVAVCRPRSTM